MRIVLILPYFGTLPNYFRLWLKSAEYNPTIDFLFITDSPEDINLPCNVIRINTTFNTLKEKIQSCFDFPISLENPKKLCDYKPAYGYIFEDLIKSYDFWGHCDCDLIFGNIRSFITDDVLKNYNRILTLGHLCLYKNTPEAKLMFTQKVEGVRYYKDVYSSFRIQCFDEYCGATPIWNKLAPEQVWDCKIYDDININHWKFYPNNITTLGNVFYKFNKGNLYRVEQRNDGKQIYTSTCYVHLQKREMKIRLPYTDNLDSFYIVPNVFCNEHDIAKYTNKTKLLYVKPWILLWDKICAKLSSRIRDLLHF